MKKLLEAKESIKTLDIRVTPPHPQILKYKIRYYDYMSSNHNSTSTTGGTYYYA